jgi:uncharacterized protein YrrD
MVRCKEIRGRAIVGQENGLILGKIDEVSFQDNRLLGFFCRMGANRICWIPYAAVQAIGPDAVVVKKGVLEMSSDPTASVGKRFEQICGMSLMSTGGCKFSGKIEDVLFDEHSGSIRGYEISQGNFSHWFNRGLRFVSGADVKVGEDYAYINDERFDQLTTKRKAHRFGESHEDDEADIAGGLGSRTF